MGSWTGPGVSGTPPEALAEMAHTIKEVRRRFPAIPIVEESHGETARLRLADAIYSMLETMAEEHPIILVVDDLHLCDDASLSLLHLIVHRATRLPIMLAFVTRAGELSRSARATYLRANAFSIGIREVEVPPLSLEESAELLSSLIAPTDSLINPSLRRAMVRAGGGYPMILELLVQDWEANRDMSLALALDAMTGGL